jgi:membrane protease YdiL (CAAX protease family)
MIRAITYLLAITVAEVIVVVLENLGIDIVTASIIGIVCHTAILLATIIDAALIDKYFHGRLVLSLSLVPLIRIISLTLPLANIPRIWQFPMIYLPLLAAAIVVVRLLDYKPKAIGINSGFIPVQLIVGLVGLGFGVAEYYILVVIPPEPFEVLSLEPTFQATWLPALVLLLSTGFVEELIFRGVLQKTATEVFGGWGIVYVSYIFAILHIGFQSWIDVVFVFGVALFFGGIVKRTGSLLGVTLSHGITNIILFIVAQFYF